MRPEDDEMVSKLKSIATKNLQAAREQKDDIRQVRLLLDQISPYNYEKKQAELRTLLFGDKKLKGEEGFDAD